MKDALTETREDEIAQLLIAGERRAAIHAHAKEKKWDIGPDWIDKLIQAARRKIRLTAEYDRKEHLGLAIKRYGELFRRNLKIQDYKAAMACVDRLVKLLHLDDVGQDGEAKTAVELLKAIPREDRADA